MPCAAGARCNAVPDHTPGPPQFTNHQCRGVCGQYLHGTCGLLDPRGTSEMHRICHACATSRERETPGAGTAGAQADAGTAGAQTEKRDSQGGKGKSPAGAGSGVKLGQHVAKKPGGAAKRKRVSVEEKLANTSERASAYYRREAARLPVSSICERSDRKEVPPGAKPCSSRTMHAPGENDFLIPSANPPDRSQRPTRPGFLFTLLLAVGVFGVSTGAAHFFFPRGLNGRPGAGALKGSLVERGEDGYETWECAGNRTGFPVMEGADLVSYFSLPVGEAAMYGTEDYQARYNGYTFFFVSEENKALFEAEPLRYMPAWGGFCAYGIALEDWWTRSNLGPDADPNSWFIPDGGRLHFFRSEYPKRLFMANVEENLKLGEANWNDWWGDELPAGAGKGSPLNTACFCSIETCFDQ